MLLFDVVVLLFFVIIKVLCIFFCVCVIKTKHDEKLSHHQVFTRQAVMVVYRSDYNGMSSFRWLSLLCACCVVVVVVVVCVIGL
jgi:hypothetical protein